MARQPGEFGFEDTSLQAMGGEEAVRVLVDRFYDVMDTLPEAQRIRRMHPANLEVSRDKLTVFLIGWLGGPRRYSERWGPMHIPHAHAHLTIDEPERDAWLSCMHTAMAEMPVADDFRAYFMREINVPANRVMQVSQRRREG